MDSLICLTKVLWVLTIGQVLGCQEYKNLKSWLQSHGQDQQHGLTRGQKKYLNALKTGHYLPVLCSWQISLIDHSSLFLWIKLKPPVLLHTAFQGGTVIWLELTYNIELIYYPRNRGINLIVINISEKHCLFISASLCSSFPCTRPKTLAKHKKQWWEVVFASICAKKNWGQNRASSECS